MLYLVEGLSYVVFSWRIKLCCI